MLARDPQWIKTLLKPLRSHSAGLLVVNPPYTGGRLEPEPVHRSQLERNDEHANRVRPLSRPVPASTTPRRGRGRRCLRASGHETQEPTNQQPDCQPDLGGERYVGRDADDDANRQPDQRCGHDVADRGACQGTTSALRSPARARAAVIGSGGCACCGATPAPSTFTRASADSSSSSSVCPRRALGR